MADVAPRLKLSRDANHRNLEALAAVEMVQIVGDSSLHHLWLPQGREVVVEVPRSRCDPGYRTHLGRMAADLSPSGKPSW